MVPKSLKLLSNQVHQMKLPVVSGGKAIKAFLHAGFVKVRQRGSQVVLSAGFGEVYGKVGKPVACGLMF